MKRRRGSRILTSYLARQDDEKSSSIDVSNVLILLCARDRNGLSGKMQITFAVALRRA